MTPEDLNSLKKQVRQYARKDRWKEAEPIFNQYPDMVRIPLTDDKDTALHVAVEANSITFVKGLVDLMTTQDLEIKNRSGWTAFFMAAESGKCAQDLDFMAAESGKCDSLQIMIQKYPDLPIIKSGDGFRPVLLLAARLGQHKVMEAVFSETLLQNMDFKDIQYLFHWTIEHDMFDVATKVFDVDPGEFAFATYGFIRKQSVLEMLLRKPSKKLSTEWGKTRGASSREALQLLEKIWRQLRTQLGRPEIYDWMRSRSSVLVDALESGNVEALKWLLVNDEKLCELPVNSNKQNIQHYAVRKRHSSFVNFILYELRGYILTVDDDDNNILHLAAYPLEKEETSSTLRPTTQMTRDVKWFKEIEKKAHPRLRTMRNKEGKTPKDVFHDEHKELSKQVKDTAKGIADSGMLVAALVATVAFAAAVTVPGNNTGPWFTVFILANAAALFTSSASILSFLSNFTSSRFADSEFVIALHPSLILGPMLLLISIVTMVISFAAASFLIFGHTSKWAAYVVASMGVFPILLFLLFQVPIFDTFLWSRFYHMSYA